VLVWIRGERHRARPGNRRGEDGLRLYVAYSRLFPPFLSYYGEAGLRRDWLPTYCGADAPDPTHPGRTRYDAILREYRVAEGMDGASLGSMLSDHQEAVGIANCLYLRTSDAFLPWVPAIYQWEFADPGAPVLGVGIAKGMDPGFALGAVHSSELNSFFPNLSNTAAIDAPDLAPAFQAMADQLVAYWASFAATGAPSSAGQPGTGAASGTACSPETGPAPIGHLAAPPSRPPPPARSTGAHGGCPRAGAFPRFRRFRQRRPRPRRPGAPPSSRAPPLHRQTKGR